MQLSLVSIVTEVFNVCVHHTYILFKKHISFVSKKIHLFFKKVLYIKGKNGIKRL